jgi:D-alanine transaminase
VRELGDSRHLRETGIAVITLPDMRWTRCDIKSVALLANVLAYETAQQAGVQDAIFVEPDGTVNEATAGNLFVVSRGVVRTPPKGPRILAGVTRDKILQSAQAAPLATAEQRISRDELLTADEIFLTSTTAEVVPVVAVDKQLIGAGKPGPISRQIYEQFIKLFVRR